MTSPPRPALRAGAIALMALLALAGVALGACGGGKADAPEEATGGTAVLEIRDRQFERLTVKPGTQIEVINRDDISHTMNSDVGVFNVGPLERGTMAALTAPSAPGEYPYACRIVPEMKGTLTVRT